MNTRSASMPRRVEPEALDLLEAGDPAARRSRNDLRRLHVALTTVSIMKRALGPQLDRSPMRILELGAGDGSLALRFASQCGTRQPLASWTLLDRQDIVSEATLQGLRAAGWAAQAVRADVFDFLMRPTEGPWDIIVANLFMHHFHGGELERLMNAVARSAPIFFCCEPRRSAVALVGSHLVGLLGAGAVTRQDAVLSVHAGFSGRELSAAWPDPSGWLLDEYSAGLFSHCLLARKP